MNGRQTLAISPGGAKFFNDKLPCGENTRAHRTQPESEREAPRSAISALRVGLWFICCIWSESSDGCTPLDPLATGLAAKFSAWVDQSKKHQKEKVTLLDFRFILVSKSISSLFIIVKSLRGTINCKFIPYLI
jgi:hypothetical protein